MLKQSSPFFKVYSQLFSIHVHVDNLYIISLYIHCLWFNYQPASLSLLKVFKLYIPFVSLALPVFFRGAHPPDINSDGEQSHGLPIGVLPQTCQPRPICVPAQLPKQGYVNCCGFSLVGQTRLNISSQMAQSYITYAIVARNRACVQIPIWSVIFFSSLCTLLYSVKLFKMKSEKEQMV